jgi:hypothetical protein
MRRAHEVERVNFAGHYMLLRVDGRDYRIDLRRQSKRLASADDRTKRNYIISPSGYGIRWPEIDEDLSIDAMIKPVEARAGKRLGRARGKTVAVGRTPGT